MADITQTVFSYAFSRVKSFAFRLQFPLKTNLILENKQFAPQGLIVNNQPLV